MTFRAWAESLQPSIELDKDPVVTVLGWPETKNPFPVAIHFHSLVAHSIYQTYGKIGDKRPIKNDEFRWKIVLSFQRRAKTEMKHTRPKDEAAKQRFWKAGNQRAPSPSSTTT
ncbi:hypothetical protein BGZ82_002346 [Podila clonocystis]|nr:hypothetical protein BGZ82_002346 [Podila clonocystis]